MNRMIILSKPSAEVFMQRDSDIESAFGTTNLSKVKPSKMVKILMNYV